MVNERDRVPSHGTCDHRPVADVRSENDEQVKQHQSPALAALVDSRQLG